jgi:hypothetical protein
MRTSPVFHEVFFINSVKGCGSMVTLFSIGVLQIKQKRKA